MSDKIKSAMEIAMEKASRLSALTPEEEQRLKWVPEGERLAALYLIGDTDLEKALDSMDRSSMPYIMRGVLSVLLPRLGLPKHETAIATNKRILDGLRVLCQDPNALEKIAARVTYVEDQYAGYGRQQLEASYQELKQQVATQVQQTLQQQGVVDRGQVDVESMPEFQSQWQASVVNLERPYEQNLEDLRMQLRELLEAKPALH